MNARSGRVALLRKLLVGLLAVLVLATLLSVVVNGAEALSVEGIALNLVLLAGLVAGLWMLRRGYLKSVVALISGMMLIAGIDEILYGISDNEASLLIFIIPITLVGLLLGRVPLFLVSAISLAIVYGVYFTERLAPGLLTEGGEIEPLGAVVIFTVVVAALMLFLDRFALSLQDSLDRSAVREAELRHEVEVRKQLEARLQIATDAAGIGLWNWDPESDELEWSPRMKELFELPANAQVSGSAFFGMVHPEDRAGIESQVETLLESEGESYYETPPYRVITGDGRTRWLVGRGVLTTLADGSRKLLGAAYDVTPLVEAESQRAQALGKEQEARRHAERIGENLSFLADLSHILTGSLEYRETLRQAANTLVPRFADWCAMDVLGSDGKLERVVVAHSDPEKVRFAHELQQRYPPDPDATTGPYAALRSGKPQLLATIDDETLRAVARDHHHYQMLKGVGFESAILAPLVSRGNRLGVLSLVQAESGRHYDETDLEFVMQIAERAAIAVDNARLFSEARELNAQLEERVERRTAELQVANRELESFTYSASHDLRAPLRGINGFSQALLEDYGHLLDDRARDYLARIHSGAVRMGELIDDLLDLSRISRAELTLERVDLSALATEVVEELRARQPERKILVSIAPRLTARGDPGLVRIVLENLLGNAWKFTDRMEPAFVEVGRDFDSGAFFVRDNGAGFNMAYSEKLFVPFQRLHAPEAYSGTGIGLATSKRIIERLGGEIWARGEEGKGATFYFTLPGEQPKVARPEAAADARD